MVTEDATGTLSLREAAGRVGVSARTMRRYVLSGDVPAAKVIGPRGPEYRLRVIDIEQLMDRRGQGSRGQVVDSRTTTVADTVAVAIAGQLQEHLTALERAWARIAELERENAVLKAQLMPGTTTSTTTVEDGGLLRRFFGR